jgi:hypothetical protein
MRGEREGRSIVRREMRSPLHLRTSTITCEVSRGRTVVVMVVRLLLEPSEGRRACERSRCEPGETERCLASGDCGFRWAARPLWYVELKTQRWAIASVEERERERERADWLGVLVGWSEWSHTPLRPGFCGDRPLRRHTGPPTHQPLKNPYAPPPPSPPPPSLLHFLL